MFRFSHLLPFYMVFFEGKKKATRHSLYLKDGGGVGVMLCPLAGGMSA